MIWLMTDDLALGGGWRALCVHAERDCEIASLGETGHLPPAVSGICCIDLGQRPGAPLDSVTALIGTHPELSFVVLTALPAAREGLEVLRAGARGYCNRLASAPVADALLATVESGEVWAGTVVTDFLLQASLSQKNRDPATRDEVLDKLTPREASIAEQVAAGASNKLIAIDNGISERTVKAHLNSVFRKTGLRNRVQLALVISQSDPGLRQSSGA